MNNNNAIVEYMSGDYASVKRALEVGCPIILWKGVDEEEIKRVVKLTRKYKAQCFLVDHPELIESTGASGVHLNVTDPKTVRSMRKSIKYPKFIGANATTIKEIDTLWKTCSIDYLYYTVYNGKNLEKAYRLFVEAQEYIFRRDYALHLCLFGNFTLEDLLWLAEKEVICIATDNPNLYPPKKKWWNIF